MEPTGYHFEAVTLYDRETLRAFARAHYRGQHPVALVLLLVVGVVLVLSALGSLVVGNGSLFAWGLGMGAAFLWIDAMLFTGRVPARAAGLENRVAYRYRFHWDRVEYAGRQNQGFYFYDQFIRVVENRDYFFLYVAKNQALVIRKDGFTLGSPWQARQFFIQKVGPRYQIKG